MSVQVPPSTEAYASGMRTFFRGTPVRRHQEIWHNNAREHKTGMRVADRGTGRAAQGSGGRRCSCEQCRGQRRHGPHQDGGHEGDDGGVVEERADEHDGEAHPHVGPEGGPRPAHEVHHNLLEHT